MIIKKVSVFLFFILLNNSQSFSKHVEHENMDVPSLDQRKYEVDFELTKVRLRVRGKLAVEVPWAAKLEVRPLIEYHFVKREE